MTAFLAAAAALITVIILAFAKIRDWWINSNITAADAARRKSQLKVILDATNEVKNVELKKNTSLRTDYKLKYPDAKIDGPVGPKPGG